LLQVRLKEFSLGASWHVTLRTPAQSAGRPRRAAWRAGTLPHDLGSANQNRKNTSGRVRRHLQNEDSREARCSVLIVIRGMIAVRVAMGGQSWAERFCR
jgi:hypothetical protein